MRIGIRRRTSESGDMKILSWRQTTLVWPALLENRELSFLDGEWVRFQDHLTSKECSNEMFAV